MRIAMAMFVGLAMAMSSVTVVGNSILLGRYKPRSADYKPKRDEPIPTRISKWLIHCKQLLDDH
jgi:hypothetical protein